MMPCPKCYREEGKIVASKCKDTRVSRRYDEFRRRRRYVCLECRHAFTTYEELITNSKWEYTKRNRLDEEGEIAFGSNGFAK